MISQKTMTFWPSEIPQVLNNFKLTTMTMAFKMTPQIFRAFGATPRAAWSAQVPRAPTFRRFFAAKTEQPRLRLGSIGTVSRNAYTGVPC
jgi:hypothetical protein